MKNKKTEYKTQNGQLQPEESQKGIEILTGAVLFVFGAYQSVLYFGHTVVPISDFPAFFQVGSDILHLRMPGGFKLAPVLGILQNLLVPVSWGQSPELTAGWLLNAIVHPFTIVLLWLVGRRIIGKSAAWVAIIAAVNPWLVYMLTEPIVETTYLFFILLTIYLIFRRSRWAYLLASITTMVRYEGAALILAAFVVDVIHRKDRRDVVKAIAFSLLASLPLAIWLVLTAVNWQAGTSHYFNVLFTKEYAKGFVESKSSRTGIGLHLHLLWQTGFQPLLLPYIGASSDFAEMLFKMSQIVCIAGFLLGCIWAGLKRRWEVLVLLLFFVPYFILHSYYPYPLARFHSTIFWIALLVVWFGLQNAGGFLSKRIPLPRPAGFSLLIIMIAIMVTWCISLAKYFPNAAKVSPTSASLPCFSMFFVAVLTGSSAIGGLFGGFVGGVVTAYLIGRLFGGFVGGVTTYLIGGLFGGFVGSVTAYLIGIEWGQESFPSTVRARSLSAKDKLWKLTTNMCVFSAMCLVIASNQFVLTPLLGDGKREIEFKQLGEWFSANAGPGEKLAVYNNITQVFAGKNAANVVGYPRADGPEELVTKLRDEKITYVAWATREGYSHGEHTGYQQIGLNRNIAFLDRPRSIACYQFVTQIGSQRGFIYVFRLTDKGDEKLPSPGK